MVKNHFKNYQIRIRIRIITKIDYILPCHTSNMSTKFRPNQSTTFWDIVLYIVFHPFSQWWRITKKFWYLDSSTIFLRYPVHRQTDRQGWKHNLHTPQFNCSICVEELHDQRNISQKTTSPAKEYLSFALRYKWRWLIQFDIVAYNKHRFFNYKSHCHCIIAIQKFHKYNHKYISLYFSLECTTVCIILRSIYTPMLP